MQGFQTTTTFIYVQLIEFNHLPYSSTIRHLQPNLATNNTPSKDCI